MGRRSVPGWSPAIDTPQTAGRTGGEGTRSARGRERVMKPLLGRDVVGEGVDRVGGSLAISLANQAQVGVMPIKPTEVKA